MQRLLILAAVVLFALAALLVVIEAGDRKLTEVLMLAGLACFAGGHAS